MRRTLKKLYSTIVSIFTPASCFITIYVGVPEAINQSLESELPAWLTPADLCWSLVWGFVLLSCLVFIWSRKEPTIVDYDFLLGPGLHQAWVVTSRILFIMQSHSKAVKTGTGKGADQLTRKLVKNVPDMILRLAGCKERDKYVSLLEEVVHRPSITNNDIYNVVIKYCREYLIRGLRAENKLRE